MNIVGLVGVVVLLEVKLERDNFVELDPGDAAHKALRHTLVLADVEVADVIELSVRTRLQGNREVVNLRLVVVD